MSHDPSVKEPDAATLRAIKRILDEPFDDAIARKLQEATRTQPVEEDFITKPVENIEGHRKGPKFTTVPQIDDPVEEYSAAFDDILMEEEEPAAFQPKAEPEPNLDPEPAKPRAPFKPENLLNLRTALIGAALIMLITAPAYFVLVALSLMLFAILVFMALGGDRIWGMVEAHLNRVSANDPERGHALRAKLDRWANRWDSVLDRFPEGSVDGLYMPDFSVSTQSGPCYDSIMAERIKRMQGEA